MALTGIEIFKLLPKTNCGDCGVPTCLAFAMSLAAGKAELSACPHVSAEATEKLSAASAPPILPATIGTGDRALKSFADTLRDNIRSTDIFARLGGEEFWIILPHTNAENAVSAAEKLRRAVESSRCEVEEHHTLQMTVSIGVATCRAGSPSFESVMKLADTALYQAKRQGRNLVVLHPDL